MFGLSQPYSGHFFYADYLEYDMNTKKYKTPVRIRIKGQSEIGVSTGVKETVKVNENGRWVIKNAFKVNVVEINKYKPKDKVKFLNEDIMYVVLKVGDNVNNPNAMVNLMFPKIDNRDKVLYLGED